MTHSEFDEWITQYGKAWVALNPDAVMNMLDSEDLTYYFDPFSEPKRSWDEVKTLWSGVPTNQKDVTFWHEIILVDDDRVLAHIKATRTLLPSGEKEEIDGAFVFGINQKGLCTYFRQWRVLK